MTKRKMLAALLAGLITLSLAGCGANKTESTNSESANAESGITATVTDNTSEPTAESSLPAGTESTTDSTTEKEKESTTTPADSGTESNTATEAPTSEATEAPTEPDTPVQEPEQLEVAGVRGTTGLSGDFDAVFKSDENGQENAVTGGEQSGVPYAVTIRPSLPRWL